MKPWGTATVTTKGDYQGANRVLVFRTSDGKLVADGVTYLMGYEDDGTTPIMKAETPRLKAGSYTIVAFNKKIAEEIKNKLQKKGVDGQQREIARETVGRRQARANA